MTEPRASRGIIFALLILCNLRAQVLCFPGLKNTKDASTHVEVQKMAPSVPTYLVKWDATVHPPGQNVEKSFIDAAYPVKWDAAVHPPGASAPPPIPGQNVEKSFTDAAYPVKWDATVRPPGAFAAPPIPGGQNVEKSFADAAYPVKWDVKVRSPGAPAPPPIPSEQNDEKSFRDAAYPVKWNPALHPPIAFVPPPVPSASNVAEALARQDLKVQPGMLFLKKSLYPGAILPEGTKLANAGVAQSRRFTFRADADAMPFDYQHLDTILRMFDIPRASKKAEQVAETLRTCGEAGDSREPQTCATSRQAVVEFAADVLGTSRLQAARTVVHGLKEPLRYVVASNGVTRIGNGAGDAVVPCHPLPYPYDVFYCHRPSSTQALMVELAGVEDGTLGAMAVAVCHMNTSDWDGHGGRERAARREQCDSQERAWHWKVSSTSNLLSSSSLQI